MSQECELVRQQLPMYLYGELTFDQEETVDAHLDVCDPCRQALDRSRDLHASLDGIAVEPSPALLRACREQLQSSLRNEPRPAVPGASWWSRVTQAFRLGPNPSWVMPLGSAALIAIGFFGGRVAPEGTLGMMGLTSPEASRVRYVSPGSNGQIQIVLDETRQRTVTGGFDDNTIRALLLSAAKDPSDPGLRAETLTILTAQSQTPDVRSVLLQALEHDQNAGVRLKALEGLRPFARDREVQNVLARVLLSDTNPGIRTQAIDLLATNPQTDRDVVGALQELMGRESNDYIRERGQRLLEAVQASAEIY